MNAWDFFKSSYSPEEWEKMERGQKPLEIITDNYTLSYCRRLIHNQKEKGKTPPYGTKQLGGKWWLYKK